MENIKQKRLVIFKTILLTIISASAGFDFHLQFASSLDNASFLSSLNQFVPYLGIIRGAPRYFFLFMFVALSQWILFSDKLPQKWLLVSILGAIVAGLLASVSRNLLFIPKYPLMELRVNFLNGCFLVGFFATIPQWLLLRKRWKTKSYYWLLVNSIGWGIVGFFLYQELAVSYTFGFGKVKVMIFDLIRYYRLWYIVDFCSFIPLGLGIALFFTQSETKQKLEGENKVN